ncbi:HicA mRNA interferase family [Acididesulfobacillus acetoxydans]|uniref:HicA mRNA interferase family n=1 Tax=Acididesulfobacillus acetoxydans TaxID=1561005 RepID=A0A8S0WVQ5_9FIRM|nr:type II toxin-antitoxin system HicA family toxin [Acididesulfobacillus acetoxydans]CAA7599781.1 HicA mRNA interferase family [Acididesulfobacillus acetoxydans]CEJ07347.1 Ribonucleotide reductase, stirrup [Acididesulfobacillus acetoxydans]
MTVREVLRVLNKDGSILKETKGSHIQLIHPIKPGKVTLPNHKGDIPSGGTRQHMEAGRVQVDPVPCL